MTIDLNGRSFLKLLDFSPDEIRHFLALAADLKAKKKAASSYVSYPVLGCLSIKALLSRRTTWSASADGTSTTVVLMFRLVNPSTSSRPVSP